MKFYALVLLAISILTFSGCYLTEDAADVNQERINATYCTVFNATRGYTKSILAFKFGNTPLRLSNAMYFRNKRLYEEDDIIWGLHYARDVDGINNGTYEWTDENGHVYFNEVPVFGFELENEPQAFKKHQYYDLAWIGDQIPYEAGEFSIQFDSHVDGRIYSFHSGRRLEIESDYLDHLPSGRATLTLSRNYSEPIDEGTQAGGESGVSFVREYEITITD